MRKSSLSPLLYESEMEEKWREKNGGILMEEKWSAQMEGKWRDFPPFSLHLCTPFSLHFTLHFPSIKIPPFFSLHFSSISDSYNNGERELFLIFHHFFGSSIFPSIF